MLSLLLAHALADDVTPHASEVRKFLARRMTVAPLRITTVSTNQYGGVVGASSVDLWTVYQGENTIVRADDFAKTMNDQPTLDLMEADRRKSSTTGWLVAGAGAVATAGGLYWMITGMNDDRHPYALGPILGGTTLTTLGVCTLAFAPAFGGVAKARQGWVKNYYSEDQAGELVDGYNQRLLTDLGISKDDVITYLKQKVERDVEVHPWVGLGSAGVVGTF